MANAKTKAKKPAPAKKKPAPTKKKPAPAKTKAAPAKTKKPAPKKRPAKQAEGELGMSIGHTALLPVLGSLRSVIYKVTDLERAKAFYATALGRQPYFDESFYVGFDIDGQELGLDPDVSSIKPGPGGSVAYWKVADIHAVWDRLTTEGGEPLEPPHSVGGEIATAIIGDPFGNLVGLIQLGE